MSVRDHERGQMIAETALFLPLALAALFGIIYVIQYGVVSERAQLTVRYGGLSPYINPGSVYSAANIYGYLANPGSAQCTAPPVGVLTDSVPLPGPSTAPFWQPSGAAPSSSCTIVTHRLGGAQFLASHYFAASLDTVTAQSAAPPAYLSALNLATTVTASEPFVHPADPKTILNCSKEVANHVTGAINVGTSAVPTPDPQGNGLTHNC